MGEMLHPGIYNEEVLGQPPLEPLSTSIAGFIGTAIKGPIGVPTLITNFEKFKRVFGGFDANSVLAYAVRGFFENGGSKCYIVRTVHYDNDNKTSAEATKEVMSDSSKMFAISAINDGIWGNKIEFEVEAEDSGKSFSLLVYYNGVLKEEYSNLTLENVEDEVSISSHIKVIAEVIEDSKDITFKNVSKTKLEGGKDGIDDIADADYLGSGNAVCGLATLRKYPVNFVAIPGETSQSVYEGLLSYVDNLKNCVAILDSPAEKNPESMAKYIKDMNLNNSYSAIYYPSLVVSDPIGVGKKTTKVVPPCGHVIGAIATCQDKFGVWEAPAGTKAKLKGILGLNHMIDNEDQDILNPNNINALRVMPRYGLCIWGTRTLSNGDFKYLPVRTLNLFIEQYLDNDMLWTVFKPNGEGLWGSIRLNISTFLTSIWGKGGLKGASTDEAFFVKCDAENNPNEDVDRGITTTDIGISALKPSEFIKFRISHKSEVIK